MLVNSVDGVLNSVRILLGSRIKTRPSELKLLAVY